MNRELPRRFSRESPRENTFLNSTLARQALQSQHRADIPKRVRIVLDGVASDMPDGPLISLIGLEYWSQAFEETEEYVRAQGFGNDT